MTVVSLYLFTCLFVCVSLWTSMKHTGINWCPLPYFRFHTTVKTLSEAIESFSRCVWIALKTLMLTFRSSDSPAKTRDPSTPNTSWQEFWIIPMSFNDILLLQSWETCIEFLRKVILRSFIFTGSWNKSRWEALVCSFNHREVSMVKFNPQ